MNYDRLNYDRRLKSGFLSSNATATNTNEGTISQAAQVMRDQIEEKENMPNVGEMMMMQRPPLDNNY